MMAMSPCPRKENCTNNHILLVDSNAILNLMKTKLPKVDRTYSLRKYFRDFLSEYDSLLNKVFACSIDGNNYITKKIFEEIDMENSRSSLRCEPEFKVLRVICQNLTDFGEMNEVHRKAFSIKEIDDADLKKLRESGLISKGRVSNQDLSLAVLALRKILETDQESVIITDDEDFKSFLRRLRSRGQISMSFGHVNCSKLSSRYLSTYLAEIYECCKMEKSEYETVFLRLCKMQEERTDLVDIQKKKLKQEAFDVSTSIFIKTTITKYPNL